MKIILVQIFFGWKKNAHISTVFNSRVAILYLQVLHSAALSTVQLKLFIAQFYDTSVLVYLPN